MMGKDLLDSMEYVDAALVAEAECHRSIGKKQWRRALLVTAACLVLVVGIYLLIPAEQRYIVLSAGLVAEVFEADDEIAGETNQYHTVLVTDPEILQPLPDTDRALVFHRNDQKLAKNEKELREWITPIIHHINGSLQASIPDGITDNSYYGMTGVGYYSGYGISTGYSVLGQAKGICIERSRELNGGTGDCELRLDGELVAIDTNQSEEEIIASLESIKQKLFVIFDVEFPDVKVIKYRNEGQGAVYFYDESAHPLNQIWKIPVTDCIRIVFDEWDFRGIHASEDQRITAKITYCQYRIPPEARYQTLGTTKLISLEKAEELLEKGYVFVNGCPDCIAQNPSVDFSDYDYVAFEYVADSDRKGLNLVIPCYAFYKEKNATEDSYYKTYVCAAEIPGLELYMDMQTAEHHSG